MAKPTTPPPPKRSQGPQQRSGKKRGAPPPPTSKSGRPGSRKWLYIATAGVAAVVAVALILVSVLGGSDSKPAAGSEIDGTSVTTLLNGIPQNGATLGSPDAPVTLVEYADPRCPFCARWSDEVFPTLVEDYVRPGTVRIEYRGIPLLGPGSIRPLAFVYAAGDQNRLWTVADLMYQNQGPESETWVTDDLMRGIGNAVPGFDTDQMFADLDAQGTPIDKAAGQAASDDITSTPSFLVGPTGGALESLDFSEISVEPFREAIDAALGS